MPTSITRQHFSGSTNGLPIPVAATATPGTLLHTAVNSVNSYDEMHLWVSNVSGSAATLTLEWGGVSDPASHLVKALSIPANSGPTKVALGQTLGGGLAARALASAAGVLNITGYVNRISQ
jgi:hypothetical protein